MGHGTVPQTFARKRQHLSRKLLCYASGSFVAQIEMCAFPDRNAMTEYLRYRLGSSRVDRKLGGKKWRLQKRRSAHTPSVRA